MKRKLEDLATISTGVHARPSDSGDLRYCYIQARNFDKFRQLNLEGLEPWLGKSTSLQRHILKPNEVVVAAKGNDYFGAMPARDGIAVIPSTVFLVLRQINEQVLPEYLIWWLNHPKNQRYLHHLAKGTSLPAINKQTLGGLEIPVPPLEKQQLIVKIAALQTREKQLLERLTYLRETMLHRQLLVLCQGLDLG